MQRKLRSGSRVIRQQDENLPELLQSGQCWQSHTDRLHALKTGVLISSLFITVPPIRYLQYITTGIVLQEAPHVK